MFYGEKLALPHVSANADHHVLFWAIDFKKK